MALNAGMFPFLAAHSAAVVALAAALADFFRVINYALSALGACQSVIQVALQAHTAVFQELATLAAAVDAHPAIRTDEFRAHAQSTCGAVVRLVTFKIVTLLAAMVSAVADPVVGNKAAAEFAICFHLPSVRRGGQHSQHHDQRQQNTEQLVCSFLHVFPPSRKLLCFGPFQPGLWD